jgi:AcrR family transcriptional regulator
MPAVPGPTELSRRTVLREGAVAFPAWWPARPRSAMLAAMAVAVAEQGFAHVRVDDVTVRARGSRRTFYTCFDDREDCLLAAHGAAVADCLLAVDAAGGAPHLALRRLMAYLAAWPAHAHLLLVGILAAGPAGVQRHEAAMDELARRLAACVPPAVFLSPTPGGLSAETLAQARLGALHRLVQQRVAAGQERSLPRLTPTLMLLAGLSDQS